MQESLFPAWVKKYFVPILKAIIEKINDSKEAPRYLFRRFLTPNFSNSGKWETLSAEHTLVVADVVAMDSPLPLKKRDTIAKASGDIPKIGMQLQLTERQLTEVNQLIKSDAPEPRVVAKLFKDTPKVVGGVFEQIEAMFLEGLSTGVTIVPDSRNVGTGIRLDFGYPTANKFGVSVLWANSSTSTPIDDIQRVLDKAQADGNSIQLVMMDRFAFRNFAKSEQVKEKYAFSLNHVGTKIPAPSLVQLNSFLQTDYGFTIEIVDRSMIAEKNGNKTTFKPWAEGAVVFLPGEDVGTLEWAELAEQAFPVSGVTYETVEDYLLISKYRETNPLQEFTSSQARVAPIIQGADAIYLLDSKTVQG